MDKVELYEQRKQNIIKTTNHQEGDQVPVLLDAITWQIAYAGKKTTDVYDDTEKYVNAYLKTFKDIYCDCAIMPGIGAPLKAMEAIGGNGYFISDDGVTIQHKETASMKADEYPQFLSDMEDFLVNVLPKRKYSKLNDTYDEVYNALKTAAIEMERFTNRNKMLAEAIHNEGIVELVGAPNKSMLDNIFERFRGFKNTLSDMRKQPENLIAACDKLWALYKHPDVEHVKKNGPVPPYPFIGYHITPFIGTASFNKFWLPDWKKGADLVINAGGKIFLKSEGNSAYTFDMLKDYPKDSFILQLEAEDPYDTYKQIGDYVTLICGITLSDMKYRTKQECIDIAKKAIDTFAPGGGFIFGGDRPLLGPNDTNVENLIAVNEFVRDYGKY